MTFNGVDPCSLHSGISIAKEIPPGTIASTLETLSGASGEIIVGRTVKQAEYTVKINIAGKYRAQAWQIRKLIAAWACAMDVQTHQLVPTHWPTVAYDAVLKEISEPEFTFGFGVIDVVFAIPRPIARELMITNGLGASGATSINVTIEGSSYARPTLRITLAENLDTGIDGMSVSVDGVQYFGLTGALYAGNVVEITLDVPGVAIDDGEDTVAANERIDYTVTDFERFAKAFSPGTHKVSCPEAKLITMRWRCEWL